jgi:hypothetical protein
MVAVRTTWGWGASEVAARPLEAEGIETLARPPRRDALPEHTRYTDSGCEVHHSCLSCPLVRCRYDEPGGARRLLSAQRDEVILALRSEGRPISLIAQRFGISRRTVFRVLAAARPA